MIRVEFQHEGEPVQATLRGSTWSTRNSIIRAMLNGDTFRILNLEEDYQPDIEEFIFRKLKRLYGMKLTERAEEELTAGRVYG